MAVYTTIDDGGAYFNPVLYTGNASTQSITGVGFQPDWTWLKTRVATSDHQAFDAVRTATYRVSPNTTSTQSVQSASLTSFDSDGFSIGNYYPFNASGAAIASWNWKAGTTTGIGSGDVTPSSYSFNTTSGFSIVAYTGTLTGSGTATVPHGLGIAPKMVITKDLGQVAGWYVQHTALTTPSYRLTLDTTAVQVDGSSNGTMSAPTSVVFDTNWGTGLNDSGQTYIGYVFADVQGYSKFGNYVGNGQADGPFVYTGFRPSFLMLKNITTAGGVWQMYDDLRIGYNIENHFLEADGSTIEADDDNLDLLSNGFKVRRVTGSMNTLNDMYVYMSFARAPLVNSSGVPVNAR